MPSIKLTASQIQSYENNATMFMFPITDKLVSRVENLSFGELLMGRTENNELFSFENAELQGFKTKESCICEYIKTNAPVQVGNKDISISQSKYYFKECVDVKITKINLLNSEEMMNIANLQYGYNPDNPMPIELMYEDFIDFYETQLKELNLNKEHKDNDYVFLVEFKR